MAYPAGGMPERPCPPLGAETQFMSKRILVIDDDPDHVLFLTSLLADHGYETATASDGRTGQQMVAKTRPDLIILDVMMPAKSGFNLFRQLRQDERTRSIPVIIVSGVAAVLEEIAEGKAGGDPGQLSSVESALRKTIEEMRSEGLSRPELFVDKPIDPGRFIAQVDSLIGA